MFELWRIHRDSMRDRRINHSMRTTDGSRSLRVDSLKSCSGLNDSLKSCVGQRVLLIKSSTNTEFCSPQELMNGEPFESQQTWLSLEG